MFKTVTFAGLPYQIDKDGNILKRRGIGFLSQHPDKDGYLKVASRVNGVTHNAFVHRLVYEAWVEDIPIGMTVDHEDHNRSNNSSENLRLLTPVENSVDGNAEHWEVLSPSGEVITIYNLREFCREMGLHKSHLYSVLNGKPRYLSHKGWRKP